jgi:uncharacterized membrane protein (DUF373 family)
MRGAVYCALSLILANFLVEAFHNVPDYVEAAHISFEQCVAIAIYSWLWVKEEK